MNIIHVTAMKEESIRVKIIGQVKVNGVPRNKLLCAQCGYDWISDLPVETLPKQCPRCKTYLQKPMRLNGEWLSLDEEGLQCNQCLRAAIIKVGGERLCLTCLRKKGRI